MLHIGKEACHFRQHVGSVDPARINALPAVTAKYVVDRMIAVLAVIHVRQLPRGDNLNCFEADVLSLGFCRAAQNAAPF